MIHSLGLSGLGHANHGQLLCFNWLVLSLDANLLQVVGVFWLRHEGVAQADFLFYLWLDVRLVLLSPRLVHIFYHIGVLVSFDESSHGLFVLFLLYFLVCLDLLVKP